MAGEPFYLKFWANQPRWSEIADFETDIRS